MQGGDVSSNGATRLALFVVCAWTAGLFVALFDVPFLSEDFTHLAEAQRATSWLAAFDLAREPLRPLQHVFFQLLAARPDVAPGAARAVSFVLHASAIALVYAIARELALGRVTASVAALLFAVFPNVKGIAWSAAISTPGRACFVLAAFLAFLRWRRTRSRAAAACALVAAAVAAAFHENALVIPVACVAWVCASAPDGGLRARVRAAWDGLRSPLVLALACAFAAYALYLAFLRPERHHGLKSFDALPANAVKAALCTFPELVRANVVEWLRAHDGGAARAAAAAGALAFAAAAFAIVARGPALARFAVCAVAADLALPALGTGFNQRYAYLSAAWIALALASWATTSARARIAAWVLGVLWAFDSAIDLGEYRAAGHVARHELEQAAVVRARAGATRTIVFLDPTDVWGRERDIPVWNWGLPEALGRAGTAGAWRFWRTRAFHTGTHVELVDAARVRAETESGAVLVVTPDPVTHDLVPPAR